MTIYICKHCKNSFSSKEINSNKFSIHVRWCNDNPNRNNWNMKMPYETRKEKGIPNPRMSEEFKKNLRKINTGKKHTKESIEKIRIAAQLSNHQRVCKKTHDYTDKKGRTFRFDSSWEDALADRLDELDISWDRPDPIPYLLGDKPKKYFPDFYLPDYDLYLDPKNEYCRKVQADKLEVISKLINLIIIESLEDCRNFNLY